MADSDPLPSWNEGSTKRSILNFVRGVTTADGPQFVNPEERIAVFDNDGTLWSEQPFYFQFAFVLDRMKAMAPQHPEWKGNPLYAAVLAGDMKAVAAGGVKGVLELATITWKGDPTRDAVFLRDQTTVVGRTQFPGSSKFPGDRSRCPVVQVGDSRRLPVPRFQNS